MGTDIHGVFQRRVASDWQDIPSKYEEGRHYQLFAVLAGVRNGYGFAGVITGEPVEPIALPRGLPADFVMHDDSHPVERLELMGCRAEWHEDGEPLEVWMGDHSHSWASGEELLGWAEKAPMVEQTGIIDIEAWKSWKEGSQPEVYCGGISGPGGRVISHTEAKAGIKGTHVQVLWHSKLADELSYFFDEVARLQQEYGEIRFVFGFDS